MARLRAARGSFGMPRAPGEAVARPCGHQPQYGRRAGERRSHFVDGSVAAPGDDEVRVIGNRTLRELAGVTATLGDVSGRGELMLRERFLDHRDASSRDLRVHTRAGNRVDDRNDTHDVGDLEIDRT